MLTFCSEIFLKKCQRQGTLITKNFGQNNFGQFYFGTFNFGHIFENFGQNSDKNSDNTCFVRNLSENIFGHFLGTILLIILQVSAYFRP